jgi:hypothetical protein
MKVETEINLIGMPIQWRFRVSRRIEWAVAKEIISSREDRMLPANHLLLNDLQGPPIMVKSPSEQGYKGHLRTGGSLPD